MLAGKARRAPGDQPAVGLASQHQHRSTVVHDHAAPVHVASDGAHLALDLALDIRAARMLASAAMVVTPRAAILPATVSAIAASPVVVTPATIIRPAVVMAVMAASLAAVLAVIVVSPPVILGRSDPGRRERQGQYAGQTDGRFHRNSPDGRSERPFFLAVPV
ncbi:hypothetical protein GCM10009101_09210 [Brevundimonas lenta]